MSWNPTHGIPRRDEAGGGGTAVIERLPSTNTSVNRTGGTMSPRTVAILVIDTAEVAGHRVSGEVEPRHDPKYERQTVNLVRDGERLTNANDLEFRSSMRWPGPMTAFVVYDGEGSITHRCDVPGKVVVDGEHVLNLRKGAGDFKKYEKSS